MSSSITPPFFTPNKRFRNLYLSLTATCTIIKEQSGTEHLREEEQVEIEEGETLAVVDDDDNDGPKTKSIKELIKKLIKDDGLLKDSPTWYYILLTSSST
jgi:flagellar biosynthesis component FlhA